MSKFTNSRGAAALLIGAVVASALSVSAASAASCSYVFTKNLKKGSTGVEVMNLQKVLNMDTATMVASTGAGSAGNETMTFGSATHAAVLKFQAAKGISPVAGFVGSLTRAELNKVCTGTGTTTGGTTTTTGPVSVSNGAMLNTVLVDDSVGAVLGSYVFTGNGTVTGIELMRTGVSTDQTLRNVYLYDGATRLTDSASVITGGAIRFNSPSGIFSVNGSKTITVRADIGDGKAVGSVGDVATNGQIVGAKLNTVTTLGATSSMSVSGVMTSNLTVASVSNVATVNLTGSATANTVNAGVLNQNLWSRTADVGQRAVMVRGMTFKYVGSAPIDSIANIGLYIDSVKVGSGSIDANNRVVFDMNSSPLSLQTGSHSVQLRGDVVKGSFRTFEFSIDRQADIMIEDSSLSGVMVGATAPTNATVAQNVLGGVWTISAGTLTVNQDPAFTTTKAIGGTANTEISKFKLQAYGEDVKIETLVIQPKLTGAMAPAAAGLQNVSLFVNGSAVGSSQNWTGPATTNPLTFNLGSSLIVPAGQSVILTVKADTKTTGGTNYTAGDIQADIVSASSIARGQNSQNTITVTNQVGRLLSIGSANVTFSKTGGFVNGVASPNTAMVKIGSYTVTAGDIEDATVTNIAITPTAAGAAATDFSALKLGGSDSSTIYGQFTNAAVQNFSMNVNVPKNTSKVFDVYVDAGSVPAAGSISTTASVTFKGTVNQNSVTQAATGGSASITFNTATIPAANVTKLTSSPVSQLVVGGASNQSIVTYNVKATGGTATLQELTFDVAATTGHADRVVSIMVGGVTKTITGATGNVVTGLNIAVPEGNTGVDVPVTVSYGTVRQPSGGVSADTAATTGIILQALKAISGSNQIVTTAIAQSSNLMQLVSTKPTLTVPNQTVSGLGNTENKIGEVTIAADAAGNLKVNRLVLDITSSTAAVTASTARIADGNTTVGGSACTNSTSLITCDFGTASLTDADGYTIAAGQSKTFSIFATVSGVAGASGTASVSTKLQAGATGISWDDINANATNLTGANVYNYPTGSYSIKN